MPVVQHLVRPQERTKNDESRTIQLGQCVNVDSGQCAVAVWEEGEKGKRGGVCVVVDDRKASLQMGTRIPMDAEDRHTHAHAHARAYTHTQTSTSRRERWEAG